MKLHGRLYGDCERKFGEYPEGTFPTGEDLERSTDAVERGMSTLDAHIADWRANVRPDFDFCVPGNCVVTQAAGERYVGINGIDDESNRRYERALRLAGCPEDADNEEEYSWSQNHGFDCGSVTDWDYNTVANVWRVALGFEVQA